MKSVTQCRTAVITTDTRQRRQPERLSVGKIDEAGNRKVRLVEIHNTRNRQNLHR